MLYLSCQFPLINSWLHFEIGKLSKMNMTWRMFILDLEDYQKLNAIQKILGLFILSNKFGPWKTRKSFAIQICVLSTRKAN